jgi:hypothetical protein
MLWRVQKTVVAVRKVIGKPHEDLKLKFLAERLCEFFCGDTNAPYGELGPPIPPSPREYSKSNP